MSNGDRVGVPLGIFLCAVIGWATAGVAGGALGLLAGLVVLVVPWRGQPAWSWACHLCRRNEQLAPVGPVPVENDRATGGVRYADGVAVTAIRLFGEPFRPTYFSGASSQGMATALDIAELPPLMRQSLGLTIESLSVVTVGARRRSSGDYPPVYDSLIGPAPYAGRRETWLIVRIRALPNASALVSRSTVATAALAATRRIAAELRRKGFRTTVATCDDIVELDRRLNLSALEPGRRRWRTLRADGGWLTTYSYRPDDLSSSALHKAWTLPADGIVQNVSIFADGTCTATVTVATPSPPTAPPSVGLRSIPGEQARALAASHCGPQPRLRGVTRCRLPDSLVVDVGPSGVLLGTLPQGERIALPLTDPVRPTRVHIAAGDAIVKRLIIRLSAAGERITMHSNDVERWRGLRMAGAIVTDSPRPDADTTVSVVDGTLPPGPRPHTAISVGPPGQAMLPAADVLITQSGPSALRVAAGAAVHHVEVELFRAENRYVTGGSMSASRRDRVPL